MILAASAIAFVLFLWWFATGAIFYLDGLSRRTFPWTIAAMTLVMAVSLCTLGLSAREATPTSAFVAAAAAVGVWGWNETLFLTGFVTGPNRRPAEAGAAGWPRFRAAAASVIHHEVLILASAIGVAALTLTGDNHVGLWTFGVLWAMRLSAKLNIFVGVPNPGEKFLPEHLRYLAGHFRRRPVGPFFALTTSAATFALVCLILFGAGADATAFEVAGVALVGAMLGLAVIEHWFLALPLPSEALWRWSLKGRAAAPENETADAKAAPTKQKSDRPSDVRACAPVIVEA